MFSKSAVLRVATVSPSARLTLAFQPSAFSRVLFISLRGEPLGCVTSNAMLP